VAWEFRVAAVRPYWKGYIKLALVSCPIDLFTASTSGERVAFRQINKKTGNRIRQQLVDDVTRQPVEAQDKGRGYEYAKDSFVMIEDEELESVEIESNHTIEIDSFVPRAEIDERYLESPYYIAPNNPVAQEAFAVIREAMRSRDMVALGRVVLSKRERVIMLQPWDKGLLGTTLRYPYELKDAEGYFAGISDVKVAPELLGLAQHILKSKESKFDPTKFVDRYEQAVVEMLQRKQSGLPVSAKTIAPQSTTPDLFEAFRRSLAEEMKAANDGGKPKAAKAAPPKKAKPKVDGQRELLLPIPGGKAEEKQPAKVATSRRKAS
jgi:DNA end-binding protein Ku